jgi:hypothetical protein
MPVNMVAANRYSTPWLATSDPMSNAMEPVDEEIIPERPPKKEMLTAIKKAAYKLTIGLTPAIIAKERDSGIRANATVIPESMSIRILENQDLRIFSKFKISTSNTFSVRPGNRIRFHPHPLEYNLGAHCSLQIVVSFVFSTPYSENETINFSGLLATL